MQAADYYTARFGFIRIAYKGLETLPRSSDVVSHVLRQGQCTLVLSSGLHDALPEDMSIHLIKHGDGVRDVAFAVDDCRGMYAEAVRRGAVSIMAPVELKDDHGAGSVWMATVRTYGDTVHSFVERANYTGVFLPGFAAVQNGEQDPLAKLTPSPGLQFIDHCVGNQPDLTMEGVVSGRLCVCEGLVRLCLFLFVEMLSFNCCFHRRSGMRTSCNSTASGQWTIPSCTRSTRRCDPLSWQTMTRPSKCPSTSRRPERRNLKFRCVNVILVCLFAFSELFSQEYVEYYGGPGVQHIALHTSDIMYVSLVVGVVLSQLFFAVLQLRNCALAEWSSWAFLIPIMTTSRFVVLKQDV